MKIKSLIVAPIGATAANTVDTTIYKALSIDNCIQK